MVNSQPILQVNLLKVITSHNFAQTLKHHNYEKVKQSQLQLLRKKKKKAQPVTFATSLINPTVLWCMNDQNRSSLSRNQCLPKKTTLFRMVEALV